MTLSDDRKPGADDVVEFGRRMRPRYRWLGSVLLACLAVAACVAVITRTSGLRPLRLPPPSSSVAPAPAVINVGHPILGIRATWELFGLAAGDVVTVQFGHGRIVRTAFPGVASSGPVWFVVGRGEAIVRPLDNVPGYVVPDGKPARPLTGILGQGGILLPGPSLSQQWYYNYGRASVLLIGPNGKPTDVALATPSAVHAPFQATADGRGNVLLADNSGVFYDIGPGLLRPVGATPIAVGPTNWLAMKCARDACRDVVIDPFSSRRVAFPGQPVTTGPWTSPMGAVAPDGATAAVVVPHTLPGTGTLELINLGTGAEARVDIPVSAPTYQQLAWSPDGQWLFAVTASGGLAAINMRTGRAQNLPLGVSGLSQIAIRPASG